jgi:hypothetical protein
MTPDIERRLRKYLRGIPPRARGEFAAYKRSLLGPFLMRYRTADQPYWMLLPRWLDRRYRKEGKRPPFRRNFLPDILWGQYCLFLFVRIHDDLFDGQAKAPSLTLIADGLFFEAERMFLRWMPDHPQFWKTCCSYACRTIESVLRVDQLQQFPGTPLGTLCRTYAGVNAILKVGSLAVCMRYRRSRDAEKIERFANKIAIGSQLLDDLEDLAEDLRRKRLNYVALKILKAERPAPSFNKMPLRYVANRLLFSNIAHKLLEEIMRFFADGYKALEPLQIGEARVMFRRQLQSLKRVQREILRRRAALIVHAARSPSGRRGG